MGDYVGSSHGVTTKSVVHRLRVDKRITEITNALLVHKRNLVTRIAIYEPTSLLFNEIYYSVTFRSDETSLITPSASVSK